MNPKKTNSTADATKLFQLGFTPKELPFLSVKRSTLQRYYRAWIAGGGKVPWWRRLLIRWLSKA